MKFCMSMNSQQYYRLLGQGILLSMVASGSASAIAEASVERKDALGVGQWQSNMRWTLDVSSRSVSNSDDSYSANVIGFDVHKVVSTSERDIGTLVFQPYLVNFSGKKSTPYFFDGHDTELTWRIANFNYMALPTGEFNLRIGHFEVPFGLEQNIDTNGTARQYSYNERGIKADWGVSINGVLPHFDYEVSLTRGSGNDISSRDNPYLFAGRLGSPSTKNVVVGVSVFDGRVQGAHGVTQRQRIGFDIAWYYKHWELLGELSVGDDEGARREQALAELSWRDTSEAFHVYTQYRQLRQELSDATDSGSSWVVGGAYDLSRRLSVDCQWSTVGNRLGSQADHSEISLQVRYRL